MKILAHKGQLTLELAICPWQEQKVLDIEVGFPVKVRSGNTNKILQIFPTCQNVKRDSAV